MPVTAAHWVCLPRPAVPATGGRLPRAAQNIYKDEYLMIKNEITRNKDVHEK